MPYILLVIIPIVAGILVYVSRNLPRASLAVCAGTLLAEVYLTVTIQTTEYAAFPGAVFLLTPLTRLFLVLFIVVIGLILLSGSSLGQGKNLAPAGLITLGLTSGLLTFQDPFVVSLLLQGTSLTIVFAAVDEPKDKGGRSFGVLVSAGLKYLIITTFSTVCLILAFVMVDKFRLHPDQLFLLKIIAAALTVGFGLRMSAIPFPFWLADVAEEASPLVTGLIVGVTNIAALIFFIGVLQLVPVLFSANQAATQMLLVGSILTSVFGGLLALGQKDLKRLLAFSTVDAVGYILFGVATLSAIGLTGAIFAAISLSILKTLLFVCAGTIEHFSGDEESGKGFGGLVARLPVTTFGLVVGSLGMIGVPPFSGFVGKLMVYQAAAQLGPWWVISLAAASSLPVVYYARAVYSLFSRVDEDQTIVIRREPWSVIGVIVFLILVVIGLGVYPSPLVHEIGNAVREFTFLRPV